MDATSKSFRTLEFNKIVNMLISKAISPMGKAKAAEILPSVFLEEILQNQRETSQAVSMLYAKGALPLGGIKDIAPSLKRADMGGVLSIAELLYIGDFLYVCRKLKQYSQKDGKQPDYDLLDPMFENIQFPPRLESEITRCVLNELELSDDASPKLRDLRRNIRSSEARIGEQLQSIIHSQNYKNMLQDAVVTLRSGRYCVPVKHEHRSSFPGMIHDQSGTGATLFIEPMAVVQLNNKIKELKAQEEEEVQRILAELSDLVGNSAAILTASLNVITALDFAFAKGTLSLEMSATEPVFNAHGVVNLIKARHPLIDRDKVVPIHIYIGRDFNTLLITGPNTGGKTVSLKTIGLLTLMGQAGLHIPAADHSELAVFTDVFADIGDEQSIEQSLSTFSGHMTNIVHILANVTNNSLVLLDELGAGTDPTEGAALGIAIINHLHAIGVRSVITTHYSELKVFALTTEGIENAACEFDLATLRPTYRLLIGVPGKSNAFAVSRRLGLPEDIISAARDVLSHEDQRFEDVITDLEISKKSVAIEQERAEGYRLEAERLKADLENQKAKLAASRDKMMASAREEAFQVLAKAKEQADAIIREMVKIKSSGGGQKEMGQMRDELRGLLDSAGAELKNNHEVKRQKKPIKRELKVGDRVYVHSIDQTGSIITLPSGGKLNVQVGIMRVTVTVDDISLDDSPAEQTTSVSARKAGVSAKSAYVRPELDLRGKLVDEALEELDKYLDDAYLAGLGQVSIIHGKGTGALRNAVTNHLKRHAHVKSSRLGAFGEGENGVTIIELRK